MANIEKSTYVFIIEFLHLMSWFIEGKKYITINYGIINTLPFVL